jgi:formylglycine-generating enzyme required for sulfatase activity
MYVFIKKALLFKKLLLSMKRSLLVFAAILLFAGVHANNIRVQNVTLTGQNNSASPKHTTVQFDLSWDNSWASGISWDAAWVFVKYRVGTGNWAHATISSTAAHHSITTNNGVAGTITPTTDGVGAFIYRTSTSNGSNNWQGVRLRWNYGTNSVNDTAGVTVRVFALEMVYIPQGSFYMGDNSSTYSIRNTSQNGPAHITSENAITVYSGSSAGNVSVPANFPKGYDAFYCMKYEMTQQQYIDWFNTLTVTQKNTRWIGSNANNGSQTSSGTLYTVGTSNRNYIQWRYNTTEDATLQNNVGGDRACNFLNHDDMMSFADWAGLRPMTEFEYEKACRGDQTAVAGEYAWGNTSLTTTGTNNMVNDGTSNEYNPATNANTHLTYDLGSTNTSGRYGPVRVGSFADSTSTRVKAGAGYYGVMELTGNMWENCVKIPVYSTSSTMYLSSYTRTNHGDGNLNSSGNSDVSTWPSARQMMPRGSGLYTTSYYDRVSSRGAGFQNDRRNYTMASYGCQSTSMGYINTSTSDRRECTGFRAVRTAQ